MSDWITQFEELTAEFPSPLLFKKWCAISAIAGALERKVWVKTKIGKLFPHHYIILVGTPGVGKTALTRLVYNFWGQLEHHHLAPTSITKAALTDALKDADRHIVRPTETPATVSFNSLLVCSNELGVFLPSYESDFMNLLTDIYDGNPYEERRRGKDINFAIKHPQLNLLAATTPGYLNNFLPEGAWDQGFLSRTMLVFSSQTHITDIFDVENETDIFDRVEYKRLVRDLKIIGQLYGEIQLTNTARKKLRDWHMAGGPPMPDHPKLMHYTTRRTAHLLKLSMIVSISRARELVIDEEDVTKALSWLFELERYMTQIFKSMTIGGDADTIRDMWYALYNLYLKGTGEYIKESLVYQVLQERVPTHTIARFIQVMVGSNILQEHMIPKVGKCYKVTAYRPK